MEVSYRAVADEIIGEIQIEEPVNTDNRTIVEFIEHDMETVQVKKPMYPYIWLGGTAILLAYYLFSYIRLRYQLLTSVPYDLDEDIYFSDNISIPFVIGMMNPKIYLPSTLMDKEIGYIILHEQYHIRRKDHIIKPLALCALTVHWFNPFIWMAFHFMTKDMEMSCDEAVLKKLNEADRQNYTESLLQLSVGKNIFSGISIAFGEGNTKSRIENMIKWKSTSRLVIIVATGISLCIMIICFLFPKNKSTLHPYEIIDLANLEQLECEYVDEMLMRDLVYVLKELKKTDFETYKSYSSEIELVLDFESYPIHLIYGDGVTIFSFKNDRLSIGKLWGVIDDDLARCMKEIANNRQANLDVLDYVEPWKPSKDEIEQMKKIMLSEVDEEDLSYITELVKVMNLELEGSYLYENQFEDYKGWEHLDYDKYRLYINGIGKRIDNEYMQRDVEEMLFLIDCMEKEEDIESLRTFYYKLHDMDYYFFRYGANELWFYIHDKSFVNTYFDALHIFDQVRAD